MARNVQLIKVFLASPSDVKDERDAAAGVVDELNRTLAPQLGIYVELVKWETHAAPGFSEDAQGVINQDVGDDYDIFVGVLHKRFGTKTLNGESGTAEEFDRAYSRFKRDPKSLRLLFYFKTKEFFPTESDVAQMQRIFEFRRKLGELGGLYWEFKEVSDFVAFLRVHLSKHLNDWHKSSIRDGNPIVERPDSKAVRAKVTDVGLLELTELVEQQSIPATESSARITAALLKLTSETDVHTKELAVATSGESEPARIKTLVERSAVSIQEFAATLESETKIMSAAYRTVLDTVSKGLSVFGDFGERGEAMKLKWTEQLRSLADILGTTNAKVISFGKSISAIPRLTASLARARAAAEGSIVRFSSEIDQIKAVIDTITQSVAEEAKDDASG